MAKQMSPAQRFAVGKTIEKFTRENGKYIEYLDDMNDAKIADMHDVSASSVVHLRKQIFGNLAPGSGAEHPMSVLFARIQQLEDRISALEHDGTRRRPSDTSTPSSRKPFGFNGQDN